MICEQRYQAYRLILHVTKINFITHPAPAKRSARPLDAALAEADLTATLLRGISALRTAAFADDAYMLIVIYDLSAEQEAPKTPACLALVCFWGSFVGGWMGVFKKRCSRFVLVSAPPTRRVYTPTYSLLRYFNADDDGRNNIDDRDDRIIINYNHE